MTWLTYIPVYGMRASMLVLVFTLSFVVWTSVCLIGHVLYTQTAFGLYLYIMALLAVLMTITVDVLCEKSYNEYS